MYYIKDKNKIFKIDEEIDKITEEAKITNDLKFVEEQYAQMKKDNDLWYSEQLSRLTNKKKELQDFN